jgi:hypothetical protein
VSSLVLVLLLVWFVLTVFLAAWTLWFQPYVYTESVSGLLWRAPAAGTVVFLTVLLWAWLDYQSPGQYPTLWQFSPWEDNEYPELIVVRRDGKQETYKKVRRPRGNVYLREDHPLPSRPEKIIGVRPDGERDTYEPDRDAKGNFKAESGQSLKYRDAGGQVMEEGQLGRVRTYYPGRLFLNLFLNFFHLFIWFACLWLLLHYQWSHALGMAVVLWLVMILFILPQVLRRAEDVGREREGGGARVARGTGQENLLDGAFVSGSYNLFLTNGLPSGHS